VLRSLDRWRRGCGRPDGVGHRYYLQRPCRKLRLHTGYDGPQRAVRRLLRRFRLRRHANGRPWLHRPVNVSPAGAIELFVEDSVVGQGATPAPSVSTGAATIWEMATVVFKS